MEPSPPCQDPPQDSTVKNQDCRTFLSPKVTVSNRNGNKRKSYISVCFNYFLRWFLFANELWFSVLVLGSIESPHPQFFRFIQDLQPSPLLHTQQPYRSIVLQLPLTIKTSQPAFVGEVQGWCAVFGCTKHRIDIKCIQGACATHCCALGGCSVNLHQPEDATSMPSSSQSFEPAYALPPSQPPPTIFPMATPTFSPLHTMTSLPPVPVFIPTASSSINQQQPPVYLPSPPVMHPIETPSIPLIPFPSPARILAELPSSMNPLPNPWFALQMQPSMSRSYTKMPVLWRNSISLRSKKWSTLLLSVPGSQ